MKEESETICRVQLDASHKRVAVKKTDMVQIGVGSAGIYTLNIMSVCGRVDGSPGEGGEVSV